MNVIYRCPKAKLPGGRRLIEKAAMKAGFSGTLIVKCNGEDYLSREEQAKGNWLGGYNRGNLIVLYRKTSHSPQLMGKFALTQRTPRGAFWTFLHELAHYRWGHYGKDNESNSMHEIRANKYAHREIENFWPTKGS